MALMEYRMIRLFSPQQIYKMEQLLWYSRNMLVHDGFSIVQCPISTAMNQAHTLGDWAQFR